MPNPYEARSFRSARETVDPLGAMLSRLRAVGADDDERDAFAAAWNDSALDPEEQLRLKTMTDAQLHAEVLAVRGEHDYHTKTPEEAEVFRTERVEAEEFAALYEEAYTHVSGPVTEVMGWVDGDADRAKAILAWEVGNANRKTIVGPCNAIIAAADAAAG